jgi:pimeloyl-ACP methyl ester carboxylesterase
VRPGGGSPTPLTALSLSPYQPHGIPPGVLRLEYTSGLDQQQDWALLWPPEKGALWAVVIHGHGSHGDQLYTREDIKRDWLPALRARRLGVLTPNLRDDAWMSPAAAADLHGLLQYLREQHGAERFLFVSGSMGGASNLIYACLHPQDVAACIALCPATDLGSYYVWCMAHPEEGVQREIGRALAAAYGAPPQQDPALYASHSAILHADQLTMPVYMVHGTRDELIPVAQPRHLVGEMGDRYSFAYVEIPDGDHEAPLRGFAAGFEWVMRRIDNR